MDEATVKFINAKMESHGFRVMGTGGGCEAWTRERQDDEVCDECRSNGYGAKCGCRRGGYVLITSDLTCYGEPVERVWGFGVYTDDDEPQEEHALSCVTLDEAISAANRF